MFNNFRAPGIMPMQNGSIDIDNNSGTIDIDFDQTQNTNMQQPMNNMPTGNSPIVEPMQVKVVNRTFEHIVPHVCPIQTKIINHHIYKHVYRPEYSCCEENVVCNIDNGGCCNLR